MAAKKKAAARLPVERCFFPTATADAFAKARAAVAKRFDVVAETPTSVSFRWGKDGPVLRLEPSDLETLKRYMRFIQRRELAELAPPCVDCVVLAFDDLDSVLDEINTLIESQHVVGGVTGGYMYLAWNKKFVNLP
jgi:hypothetical protein